MTQAIRMLVVEDDAGVEYSIRRILHIAGVEEAEFAKDGVAALEALQNGTFDILLCDLNIPLIDGKTVVRQAIDDQPHIRVVVLSGYATEADQADLAEMGASFLRKPFDPSQLLNELGLK